MSLKSDGVVSLNLTGWRDIKIVEESEQPLIGISIEAKRSLGEGVAHFDRVDDIAEVRILDERRSLVCERANCGDVFLVSKRLR